nr:putative competence-damage inducible protein [Streptococcus thermophilus]
MTRSLVPRIEQVDVERSVQIRVAEALAADIIDALRRRKETLALCESLTAGLATATVASVPGASDVLRGGLVTYATDLKETLAGVPEAVLDLHGPIHSATARHMARGARTACGADWGVALTGVAGPDSQDDHPVGEVYVAVSGPRRTAGTRAAGILALDYPNAVRYALVPWSATPQRVVAGQRQQIRENSVLAAMFAMSYEIAAAGKR